MRGAWLVLGLAVLAGCPKSGGEADGGSSQKQLVWVDATGAVVGPTTEILVNGTLSLGPTYIDGKGVLWMLDPETAKPTIFRLSSNLLFTDSACQAGPYIVPIPPRIPFLVGSDGVIRVRPDDLPLTQKTGLYYKQLDGTCTGGTNTTTPVGVVDLGQLPSATQPSLAFAPPLRQELR